MRIQHPIGWMDVLIDTLLPKRGPCEISCQKFENDP